MHRTLVVLPPGDLGGWLLCASVRGRKVYGCCCRPQGIDLLCRLCVLAHVLLVAAPVRSSIPFLGRYILIQGAFRMPLTQPHVTRVFEPLPTTPLDIGQSREECYGGHAKRRRWRCDERVMMAAIGGGPVQSASWQASSRLRLRDNLQSPRHVCRKWMCVLCYQVTHRSGMKDGRIGYSIL
jgi:hypothetical protein